MAQTDKIDKRLTKALIEQYHRQSAVQQPHDSHSFEFPDVGSSRLIDFRNDATVMISVATLGSTLNGICGEQISQRLVQWCIQRVAGGGDASSSNTSRASGDAGVTDISSRTADTSGATDISSAADTAGVSSTTTHVSGASSTPIGNDGVATSLDGAETLSLTRDMLRHIGSYLVPYVGFGLLNGGSATSYFDVHRNSQFSSELYEYFREPFARAQRFHGRLCKGLVPALYNFDGSPGPTFLELKIRYLIQSYIKLLGNKVPFPSGPYIPLFQMTSNRTHTMISKHTESLYQEYTKPFNMLEVGTRPQWHKELIQCQQMISALTEHGTQRDLQPFTYAAHNKTHKLGLPAGHGQNFFVLQSIYRQLAMKGYRYVTIGNIDNIAYKIEQEVLAHMVLHNIDAGFLFMPRSAVDTKGGVLLQRDDGCLINNELGTAKNIDDVLFYEQGGGEVFFNAAVGIFRLDTLVARLDDIIENLPLYLLKKQTDRGTYLQLEQITWDVMSMFDNTRVYVMKKEQVLLAAKLLLESYLTSGIAVPTGSPHATLAKQLFTGACTIVKETVGIEYHGGFWM